MKRTYYLSSLGIKMLTTILLFGLFVMNYLFIINYRKIPNFLIAIVILITLYVSISGYLLIQNRITLYKEKGYLVIHDLRHHKIMLNDLEKIVVDTKKSTDERKYCHINFHLKSDVIHKTIGYTSLIRNNDVNITKKQVKQLRHDILSNQTHE